VYAFDTNATFNPDEPRSHRDDNGGGSTYVSNASPARKSAVDKENGDFCGGGGWLLFGLFVAANGGYISSLLTALLLLKRLRLLLRPLLVGMEDERRIIAIADCCPT
jgi:hypothetical protein